jgi:hypothetical protein
MQTYKGLACRLGTLPRNPNVYVRLVRRWAVCVITCESDRKEWRRIYNGNEAETERRRKRIRESR